MNIFLSFILSFLLFSFSTDEGKNVFTGNVIKSFQEQLHLVEPTSHEQFVEQLRKGKRDNLIEKIYGEVDLRNASEEFLYQVIKAPAEGESLITYLPPVLKCLQSNPRFFGMENTILVEDPFLHGNLPSIQWEFEGGPILIRMAHPVKDLWFWQRWVEVDPIQPEFRGYLDLGKKHLYVNLMKRHGEEGVYSKAIEQQTKEYPQFYVMTLDKNSPFYWQEKKFSDLNDAKEFKDKFLNHLKGKSYFLPPWMPLAEIIEDIHSQYFVNKSELLQKERQDFIELTYLAFIDHAVKNINPLIMNISCRQAMDRGPSLALLWILSKEGEKNVKVQAALFLAPPLLIHNRPSHTERLERMLSAFSTIQKMSE